MLDSPSVTIRQGEPLQTPEGRSSQALAVNDRGDVAGFETTKDGQHLAVVWRSKERIVLHEQLEKMPALSSHPVVWSKASSIDESGNAAGVLFTSEKAHHFPIPGRKHQNSTLWGMRRKRQLSRCSIRRMDKE